MYYWLMDGRANHSIEKAIVYETCDTENEAFENINNYGNDTCIVQVSETEEPKLIYSLTWKERQINEYISRLAL